MPQMHELLYCDALFFFTEKCVKIKAKPDKVRTAVSKAEMAEFFFTLWYVGFRYGSVVDPVAGLPHHLSCTTVSEGMKNHNLTHLLQMLHFVFGDVPLFLFDVRSLVEPCRVYIQCF